jgi:hypothetical protein
MGGWLAFCLLESRLQEQMEIMKLTSLLIASLGIALLSSCSCNCNKINKDLLNDYKPTSTQKFQ